MKRGACPAATALRATDSSNQVLPWASGSSNCWPVDWPRSSASRKARKHAAAAAGGSTSLTVLPIRLSAGADNKPVHGAWQSM